MSKKICILIILILIAGCLASCNKKSIKEPFESSDIKPESYYTSYKQGLTTGKFLETPYGTYISSGDGYLYYSEKGNTKYIKLCNKPDCTHSSEDCNAYIKRSIIGYYDDKIYYVVWNNLNCMDMDGSNHKRVKTLYEGYDNNFGYFHNGYYYYVITKAGTIYLLGNDDNNLYRVKVDDDSKPEIILTNDAILKLDMFTIVGDNIYINEHHLNASNDMTISLYSYSLISKTWSKLTDNWKGAGSSYIDDNMGYCYLKNIGLYEYDLSTNEMNLVKPLEFENGGRCSVFFRPDYIYLIHYNSESPDYLNQILYIYDREYNLIDSVKFDKVYEQSSIGGFVLDVDNYIIFTSNFNEKPDYYIDKSEIGTGNLMFHKIED
jgi:hypothetical protein